MFQAFGWFISNLFNWEVIMSSYLCKQKKTIILIKITL